MIDFRILATTTEERDEIRKILQQKNLHCINKYSEVPIGFEICDKTAWELAPASYRHSKLNRINLEQLRAL